MTEDARVVVVIKSTPLEYWLATTDGRDLGKIEEYHKAYPTETPICILIDWRMIFQRVLPLSRSKSMKIKKYTATFTLLVFIASTPVRADFWGGDIFYLAQILTNTSKQLVELKNIVDNGRENLELIRDINRGINDSLRLAQTIYPNIDPGIYQDWRNVDQALQKLQNTYGEVVNSPDSQVYRYTDQQVAEAVTMNNQIYSYTEEIDQIGEAIKDYSHDVSPGGAQKLTAQSMGIMLQLMNQSLRTQATGLKLQAQTLAVENKKEKDQTKMYLETANTLRVAMKNEPLQFKTPRF